MTGKTPMARRGLGESRVLLAISRPLNHPTSRGDGTHQHEELRDVIAQKGDDHFIGTRRNRASGRSFFGEQHRTQFRP